MFRLRFLFILLIFPSCLFAFADSTTVVYDAKGVRFLRLLDTHADTLTFNFLDTTSHGFQNFNPIQSGNIPRMYLGNLGLAYKPMLLEDQTNWGFDDGRHSFDLYLKSIDDLTFYRTFSPYTNLYYVWNRRKEQYFKFSFAQNLSPRFNYAINFTRLVSLGDYARQKADHLNYDVSLWYTSKNRRYQIYTAFINNNLSLQENGMVTSDSLFSTTSDFSSEFEPVNLNNASNKISDRNIYLKQTYAFGPKEKIKLDTLVIERIVPKLRIFHESRIKIRDDQFLQTPIDSGFYSNIFYDSVNTSDRIRYNQFQNSLGIEYYTFSKSKKRKNFAALALRHDFVDYRSLGFDTLLQSIAYTVQRAFQLTKHIEWSLESKNGLIGDYQNNRSITNTLRFFDHTDENYFQFTLWYRSNNPSLMFDRYESNHYRWNNDYTRINSYNGAFLYHHQKRNFDIGVKYRVIENELYFDTAMNIQQLGRFDYIQFQVSKLFRLGKFYIDNHIYLQNSSVSEVIRLPLLHTYQSFYFQSPLFKGALNLRTGIDVRYYTSTAGYRYDPASTQFYLDPRNSFGDYPIADFFITANIKRAVLMLKVDHLNQGIIKAGDFMVNGHPLADRALKIGLRWNFYD